MDPITAIEEALAKFKRAKGYIEDGMQGAGMIALDARDELRDACTAEALGSLLDRLREAEADARRYRFMRDKADPDAGQPYATVHGQNSWGKWFNSWATGSALDEAIDAAMKETP